MCIDSRVTDDIILVLLKVDQAGLFSYRVFVSVNCDKKRSKYCFCFDP